MFTTAPTAELNPVRHTVSVPCPGPFTLHGMQTSFLDIYSDKYPYRTLIICIWASYIRLCRHTCTFEGNDIDNTLHSHLRNYVTDYIYDIATNSRSWDFLLAEPGGFRRRCLSAASPHPPR